MNTRKLAVNNVNEIKACGYDDECDEVLAYVNHVPSRDIDFYIYGSIEGSEKYQSMINFLEQATEYDDVTVHLDTTGGNLVTALMIARKLQACQANVTIFVEGACMSAGTIFMLCGRNVKFYPEAMVMFHSMSTGDWGSIDKLVRRTDFDNKWWKQVANTYYKGFLTDEEIDLITTKDGEIWLTGEESAERAQKWVEYKTNPPVEKKETVTTKIKKVVKKTAKKLTD